MKWIAAAFAALALLVVLGGAGLVAADAIARYAAGTPFYGTAEITGWAVTVSIACALPVTGAYSLYSWHGTRTARIGSLLTAVLLLACLVVIATASVETLRGMIQVDERTDELNWPRWPLVAGLVAGLCLAALGALASGIVLSIRTISGRDR